MHNIQLFSTRILNPFRGVMNCIKTTGGEAVTDDGISWTIYIDESMELSDIAVQERQHVQIPDVKYGTWHIKNGLKRFTSRSMTEDDLQRFESIGRLLTRAIEAYHNRLPFPLNDHYELWLLDEQEHPLALLDSAVSEADCIIPETIRWKAGQVCQQAFQPQFDFLDAGDIPAHIVMQSINNKAGKHSRAKWFNRNANHSRQAFPLLLLAEQVFAPQELQMIQAYQQWLAPYLLLLQTLSEDQRMQLEHYARSNALTMARLYRLYPKILDKKNLNAALVEAQLRQSNTAGSLLSAEDNKDISTFYIEI